MSDTGEELDNALFYFSRYLKNCNYSKNTVESYMLAAREFCHLIEHEENRQLKLDILIDYYEKELMRNMYKPNTIRNKIVALNCFCYFYTQFVGRNKKKRSKAPTIRRKEDLGNILEDEEIEILIEEARCLGTSRFRNEAIVRIFADSAPKVGELVNSNKGDFSFSDRTIWVEGTRKSQARLLTLDQETARVLEGYLSSRNDKNSALLINYNNSRRLTRQGVWQVLKRLAINQDLRKRVSPRAFRDTYIYKHRVLLGEPIKLVNMSLGITQMHQNYAARVISFLND